MPLTTTVLWRRLDQPGYDSARLTFEARHWRIHGAAIFTRDGRACRLDYAVVCDGEWKTVSAKVAGWIGDDVVDIELTVDGTGTWRMNGIECPSVKGCIDVDLHFTPATNTLPIRRLDLAIGREARVRAAWLNPDLSMEPLEQVYARTGPATYRYESDGGGFRAEIEVNDVGLVREYSGLWRLEAGS
jgi:hypothetical protein